MKTPEDLLTYVTQLRQRLTLAENFIRAHPCPDATLRTTELYDRWKALPDNPDYLIACLCEYLEVQKAKELFPPEPTAKSIWPVNSIQSYGEHKASAIDSFLAKVLQQNPYINFLEYSLCSQDIMENGSVYTTYWLAKRT